MRAPSVREQESAESWFEDIGDKNTFDIRVEDGGTTVCYRCCVSSRRAYPAGASYLEAKGSYAARSAAMLIASVTPIADRYIPTTCASVAVRGLVSWQASFLAFSAMISRSCS